MKKPTVYIASPYSKGDPAANAHFQCKIFDELLSSGLVLPVAPLWSHFQHMMFPRLYKELLAKYIKARGFNCLNSKKKKNLAQK
ncbi:MAG: hypothetical protein V3V31_15425 [Methylococcales bacterium]